MEQREIACTYPENRAQEHAWRHIACTNLENRAQEQVANTAERKNSHMNLENRAQGKVANTAQRRLAREWPGVLENEALWQWEITCQMVMKFDVSSGTFLYHQRCRVWNVECWHGCGYICLSSSTRSTRKKCCMDGLLSSHSPIFNKDAMVKCDMEQFSVFMRLAIHSPNFHEECTTFNNNHYNLMALLYYNDIIMYGTSKHYNGNVTTL